MKNVNIDEDIDENLEKNLKKSNKNDTKPQIGSKQLYIDKEAISVLNLASGGLLYPVTSLMNQEETNQVNATGIFKNKSYPCPFILGPGGRKNRAVLENIKKGEIVEFISEGKKVGYIKIDSSFRINKEERISKIMGGDLSINHEIKNIKDRIGDICISGQYKLDLDPKIEKNRLEAKIESLKAKKITGIMINASPIHRVHEKIMREALSSSDLLVIFLLRPYKYGLINYKLRYKSMQFFIENYLIKNKVIVIPLDDTYLYAGQNKMIMYAIIAKNFGCTKMIVGENNRGLSTYYSDNNELHSVFDNLIGIDIEIQILPEYVYCDMCKTLVSYRTCPHGHHHHISYNAESMIEFLRLGLLPPAMLVRSQISSIILSELFPNRFKNLDRIYYDILSPSGILQNSGEREFYLKLMELYQTTSLN